MTCEDFVPFIDAYVDQEFDERERAEMEVHLGSCAACRQRVEFEVKIKRELKACLEERAPESLRDRIFRDLELQMQADEAEVVELPVVAANDDVQQPFVSRAARWVAPIAPAPPRSSCLRSRSPRPNRDSYRS